MRHYASEPLRIVPVRDICGGWFASAYARNGDILHSTKTVKDKQEAIRICTLWLHYHGWPSQSIVVFKEDR